MPFWGMNPTELKGAGGTVRNLDGDAGSATRSLESSLEEAKGAVHHPLLASKIGTFAVDQATRGNRLKHNVAAAGSQIEKTAVDGDQGDRATVDDQAPATAAFEALAPAVTKTINFFD